MTAERRKGPHAGWVDAPERLLLSTDEVHVWRARLECTLPRLALLRQLLSADELERAETFRLRRDRQHFVAARALLRVMLGRYLSRDPRALRFRYGSRGKPLLMGDTCCGDGKARFSVSRSHGLALFAITGGVSVGVDVERIRFDLAYERIAERFFSPEEVRALRTLPGGDMRREAFFTCWTRKEAYVKAIGQGLSTSLDRFAVSLIPREPAMLLHVDRNREVASRWSLYALSAAPNYAASLAVRASGRELRCFQFEEAHPEAASCEPRPLMLPGRLGCAPARSEGLCQSRHA